MCSSINRENVFIWGESDLPGEIKLDNYTEQAHLIWIEIIDEMAILNTRNPAFWFTNLASRNPFSSSFLYDISLICCIKENLLKFKSYTFVVPTSAHKYVLDKLFIELKETGINVLVKTFWLVRSLSSRSLARYLINIVSGIKSHITGYLKFFKDQIFPLLVLKSTIGKSKKYFPVDFPGKKVWLVDTNADLDDRGKVRPDRYFNGIAEGLQQVEEIQLLWIYTPHGKYSPAIIRQKLDQTGQNWLHKESYLHYSDFIIPALFPILCKFLKFPVKQNLPGIDIKRLLKLYVHQHRFEQNSMQGMLCISFIKRLIQVGFRPVVFLDWFENQWMDKGLHRGLQCYSKKTLRIGYQIFQPIKNYFNIYQIDSEIREGVAPHLTASPSESQMDLQKYLKKKRPGISIPAYRKYGGGNSSNLSKYHSDGFGGKFKKQPLLAISLPVTEINLIRKKMDFLCKALDGNFQGQLMVRQHPLSEKEDYSAPLKKCFSVTMDENIEISDSLSMSSFLITTFSHVALDAILAGVPVIILASSNRINYHCIPEFAFSACCHISYTDQDFLEQYLYLTNNWDSKTMQKEKLTIQKAIKKKYYPEIWDGHIADFLTNTKEASKYFNLS